MATRRRQAGWIAISLPLALAACGGGGDKDAASKGGRGGPGGGGPATVGFVVVQETSVPITSELAGRTVAFQSSEVRPQVSGVIQKRFFTEGSLVRKGQPLYQIDPSLYRATANEASANLASAQATAAAARIKSERYRPLADMEAISKQDYTDAVATQRQAEASIAQNRATLDSARISLRFTTVPAPITGRIGRSLFTVGALVTTSQTDPLATIQQLDPIYVDIQQSSAALLALRRSLAAGGSAPASADVKLLLEDGSDYGLTGRVEFSEVVVDPATGTVTLRASFAQSIDTTAFLVPQQAVNRDPKGAATVMIVGPNNKAVQRAVKADRAQGAFWIVTSGLKSGDKVITQGLSKLMPGGTIKAVPANTRENLKPPPQGKGAQGKAG